MRLMWTFILLMQLFHSSLASTVIVDEIHKIFSDAVPVSFETVGTRHPRSSVRCPDEMVIVWGFAYHYTDYWTGCTARNNKACPVGSNECDLDPCETRNDSRRGVHLLCGPRQVPDSFARAGSLLRVTAEEGEPVAFELVCSEDGASQVLFAFDFSISEDKPCAVLEPVGCLPGSSRCTFKSGCPLRPGGAIVDFGYMLCAPAATVRPLMDAGLAMRIVRKIGSPSPRIGCPGKVTLLAGGGFGVGYSTAQYAGKGALGVCPYNALGRCTLPDPVEEPRGGLMTVALEVCLGIPKPFTLPPQAATEAPFAPTAPPEAAPDLVLVSGVVCAGLAALVALGTVARGRWRVPLRKRVSRMSSRSSVSFPASRQTSAVVASGPSTGTGRSVFSSRSQGAMEYATRGAPGVALSAADQRFIDKARRQANGGSSVGDRAKKPVVGVDATTSWHHIKIRRSSAYNSSKGLGRGPSLITDLKQFVARFKSQKIALPADLSSMAPRPIEEVLMERQVGGKKKKIKKERKVQNSEVVFVRNSSLGTEGMESIRQVSNVLSTGPNM